MITAFLTKETVPHKGNSCHMQDYRTAVENIVVAINAKGYSTTWIEGQIEGEKARK